MKSSGTNDTLAILLDLCERLNKTRLKMREIMTDHQTEAQQITRKYTRLLKPLAELASDLDANLRAQIKAHPELFVKPKTFNLAGIKIGMHTESGSIEWDDDDKVVQMLRKVLGKEDAELYIITKDKPSAKAMQTLDPKVLAKVGARVEGAGEQIVVKLADTDMDKLIEKLITAASDSQAEEERISA